MSSSQPGATGAAAAPSPSDQDQKPSAEGTDRAGAPSPAAPGEPTSPGTGETRGRRSASAPRLSEARLAEMQRLETIGRLTGGVAHDFNNILTVVIGNAELLLENLPPGDPSRHLAEVTLAAARSGADLVRMLLAYSRSQPLQPVEFNANELVEEMLDLLVRSLGARIKIETALDSQLWGIRVDRAQLGSVLLNLAVNARDAMPQGGVLQIATHNVTLDKQAAAAARLAAGDYVGIAVADSGAGIAPEVIERVFEPFFTTKQPGRGSGLGLAMVQAFVRQCGGQVRLSSKQGAGTVVRLYLPRAQIQLDLPNIGASEEIRLARQGETVLVVEDNERVRNYVVERLRRLGYGVVAATDGKSALQALRNAERVDLLFSDIDMPGLDGVKLAERARRVRPQLRILFTSAHADAGSEPDKRFRHGYRLLLKPYRKQELARMVRTTLDELL